MIPQDKKRFLKDLIAKLHQGGDPDQLKEQFAHLLEGVSAAEIAEIEEDLIKEGMKPEELRRLCDLHLALFKAGLESEKLNVAPGHPLHILLKEHEFVKTVVTQISDILQRSQSGTRLDREGLNNLKTLIDHLKEYEKHKVREENTLFPYLEKHGITQPPAIMWAEHDEQRKRIKEADRLMRDPEAARSEERAQPLVSHLTDLTKLIPDHFYKEEKILFPASVKTLSDQEWKEIKAAMDDLGYCDFTPKEAIGETVGAVMNPATRSGHISFETGTLSVEEMESMLNSLPVDITFVGSDDTVRYFSQTKDRIFPRAKTVIGRKVQQCHPQKSIHVVNQILDDFREGKRDVAEFWIQLEGRLIFIRYFPVRDTKGTYLGCVEVTQDITNIKKIEGEKRLL